MCSSRAGSKQQNLITVRNRANTRTQKIAHRTNSHDKQLRCAYDRPPVEGRQGADHHAVLDLNPRWSSGERCGLWSERSTVRSRSVPRPTVVSKSALPMRNEFVCHLDQKEALTERALPLGKINQFTIHIRDVIEGDVGKVDHVPQCRRSPCERVQQQQASASLR